MRTRLSIACLAAAILGAAASTTHGIDAAGMNRSGRAGEDFCAYANGCWFEHAATPPARASAAIWPDLAERAATDTREIVEHAAASNPPAGSDERKIGDYYAAFMDESSIEEKGLTPLEPF